MIYCDTSLLVSALTPELANGRVKRWLRSHVSGDLCVSPWVVTEISSALAMKVRRGELSSEDHADVLAVWCAFLGTDLISVPVPDHAWGVATSFCDRHELKLRAGDALHIAVASLGGHALATLDLGMASAATALGIVVETIPAT